jgi:hypothetical protein
MFDGDKAVYKSDLSAKLIPEIILKQRTIFISLLPMVIG